MKRLSYVIALFGLSAFSSAFAATMAPVLDTGPGMAPRLDHELKQQVLTMFPAAKIVTDSSGTCNDAVGLVIQTQESFPLHALYVVQRRGKWIVTDLPLNVDFKGGTLPNFLSDYWNGTEVQNRVDIRCVDVKTDARISPKNNGVFVKPAMAKATTDDLCFSAGASYNSWVCFRPTAVGKPQMSFVQMNAD